MPQKFLPLLITLTVLGGAACVAPGRARVSACSKPGWGRTFSPEEQEMTVRAVRSTVSP